MSIYCEIRNAITKEAERRFGRVISLVQKHDGREQEYFIACERREHPFPSRPFMTITAGYAVDRLGNINVHFFWGHYDLSRGEVFREISQQLKVA